MTNPQRGHEYVWQILSISTGRRAGHNQSHVKHPLDEADRQNEPEVTPSLSKKQLHKCIGIHNVLPDLDARCCTRAYLVRVHLDEVYSVSTEQLLTFDARLQPDDP